VVKTIAEICCVEYCGFLRMLPKRKKINLYVDLEDLAAIKSISKRTMIPMATLIRRGIKAVVKEYSTKHK
jgi:hypothetical protein